MTELSAPSAVPPGLFFRAKDLKTPPKVENGRTAHDVEIGRRSSQLGSCLARVEALAKDLRSLKSFDEMGNVESAAEQVNDRLADTEAVVGDLVLDISKAAARYRKADDAVGDGFPATISPAGPKPGHAPVPAFSHHSVDRLRGLPAKGGRR